MSGSEVSLLLKGGEVARRLAISRSQAYRLMAGGELRVVQIGRVVRCRPEDLEKFIQDHLHGGPEASRIERAK